jgi:hypothetical protein
MYIYRKKGKTLVIEVEYIVHRNMSSGKKQLLFLPIFLLGLIYMNRDVMYAKSREFMSANALKQS